MWRRLLSLRFGLIRSHQSGWGQVQRSLMSNKRQHFSALMKSRHCRFLFNGFEKIGGGVQFDHAPRAM